MAPLIKRVNGNFENYFKPFRPPFSDHVRFLVMKSKAFEDDIDTEAEMAAKLDSSVPVSVPFSINR